MIIRKETREWKTREEKDGRALRLDRKVGDSAVVDSRIVIDVHMEFPSI